MATVRLSDAVIPEVYNSYTALDNPELTAIWNSGIIVQNAMMDQLAGQAGIDTLMPFWLDLDPTIEPNYSNDDPADIATPNKIGSNFMKARKAFLNQSYSDMDLVSELAGSDPMQRIKNRFGVYWDRQYQRRLIATMVGVIADNVANDNGDMGVDASAAATIDGDVIIDASATMGDAPKNFAVFLCHSAVATRLIKNDEIVYVPDSAGNLTIATFKGMRVIEDDSMPIVSGTGDSAVYLSMMFGRGTMGFGGFDGAPAMFGSVGAKNPSWVERQEQAGNGGGMEVIGERKTIVLQPFGYSWVEDGAAMVEFSPTLADLRKAAFWNRVVSRKQIPFAWVKAKAPRVVS